MSKAAPLKIRRIDRESDTSSSASLALPPPSTWNVASVVRGPRGAKGDKGNKGERGPQGIRGEQGPMGEITFQTPLTERGLALNAIHSMASTDPYLLTMQTDPLGYKSRWGNGSSIALSSGSPSLTSTTIRVPQPCWAIYRETGTDHRLRAKLLHPRYQGLWRVQLNATMYSRAMPVASILGLKAVFTGDSRPVGNSKAMDWHNSHHHLTFNLDFQIVATSTLEYLYFASYYLPPKRTDSTILWDSMEKQDVDVHWEDFEITFTFLGNA